MKFLVQPKVKTFDYKGFVKLSKFREVSIKVLIFTKV